MTNIEQEEGKIIKFVINGMNVLGMYPPGKTSTLRFVASRAGKFDYSTEDVSSPIDNRFYGRLVVEPDKRFESKRIEALALRQRYMTELFKLPEVDTDSPCKRTGIPARSILMSMAASAVTPLGRRDRT